MSAAHKQAACQADVERAMWDDILPVPLITARWIEPDPRLMEIVLGDGPLTPADRAYMEAAEYAAGLQEMIND